MQKHLLLIDGMAIFYRAHFALINNPLKTSDGRHTSGVFGFFNAMQKILAEENPEYFAVVLDSPEPTFRHKLSEDYKATRDAMPDELVSQITPLLQLLEAANIPMLRKAGFEADDILGTLAKQANQAGIQAFILSGDKDLMQLVNDNTFLITPASRFAKQTTVTREMVQEKWGVSPEQMIDFLTLMGDSSDNIPGVQGVGKKTASKLLTEYGNLDGIYDNINRIKNKRVQNGLVDGRDTAILSKKLVTIDCNVPLDMLVDDLKRRSPNATKVDALLSDLELYSLREKLLGSETDSAVELVKPDKNYRTVRSEADLQTLLDELHSAEIFAFDTESTGLDAMQAELVGFSFSTKAHGGWYVPVQAPENNLLPAKQVIAALKPLLENAQKAKIAHNAKYDMLLLEQAGISVRGANFDTIIAANLVYPEKHSYKLDKLALEFFKYEMKPFDALVGKVTGFETMAEVPLDNAAFYAAEDADLTFQLFEKLAPMLKDKGLQNLFDEVEMPLVPVLVQIEKNGIFLDLQHLKNLSEELEGQIDLLLSEIYAMAGREFNLNSPKQLGEILFDELKLRQVRKRSTAVQVLNVLKKYHPLPEKILEYRHLAKLKSTYIDALPEHVNPNTGRVHTSLNQVVAATGRLSSTKPNFQNIPIRTEIGRKIREAFVPEKSDWQIFAADYSQIELRVMAHFSEEKELLESFQRGDDIHRRTAGLVNSIPDEFVSDDMRRQAKTVNFAIMYGAGPYNLSQQLDISMRSARELLDNYFRTYPRIKNYMDNTIATAEKEGAVRTLLGRTRPAGDLSSSNNQARQAAERAIINMPIQGTAAELIKIAMVRIHRQMMAEKLQSKMILQIHDELLFEMHPHESERLKNIVREGMEKAMKLRVPLKVDGGVGANWLEAH